MKILVDCYFSEIQEKKYLETIPEDREYCIMTTVFGRPFNVAIRHGEPIPVPDCKFVATYEDSFMDPPPMVISYVPVKRSAASFSEKRER